MSQFTYPDTRRDETKFDTYGTEKVADPYQWLEDPDSEETTAWVANQNKVTDAFLNSIPIRNKIKDRMTELYNYPKYGCPFKRGDKYYFFKNDGLQNQDVLYRQNTLTAEPELFFDPNKLSDDGTVSLSRLSFSESGEYFAYMISKSGSDWNTIKVKPTRDGTELNADQLGESLEWVKFSGLSWTHDNKGFFYSRYPQPASLKGESDEAKKGSEVDASVDHAVYYHFIGTKQEEDKLIFNSPENPKWLVGAEVSEDGQYVIIEISQDCDPVNLFYYCELSKLDLKSLTGPIPVVKLINEFKAKFSYVTNEGTLFYLKSNLNAPKDKLIAIDLAHPEESAWKEIIPERENEVLSLVGCVNHDKLLVIHMKDICDYMGLYDLNGKLLENIPMPTLGTIVDLQGRKNQTEFFYKFSSFLSPASFFHYDFNKPQEQRNKLFREVNVKDFDASEYETQQVFYNSKDGTRIPMFLVHKKGLVKDGNNPVLLYGYGGFSISIQPYFSALRVVLLKHLHGIFAVANIRGGAEYGEEWHKAGTKDKKQNCFDDFCAAAEYLIDNKYSRPEKIAINGGSNGGLLVAACANQRPELFGVAVPQVGVLDMLKFHKFTIGYAWTSDYGCADNAEDFKYLIKYSPLHNVPKKKYPALLVTTADHDDRVSPLHSFKYISEVQHQLGKESFQTAPLLIRIETKAGHGAGKPTTKIIQEYADMYSFIFENLKLQWFD